MCRLFGFRSVIPSQVHQSLVGAENALMLQSDRHPDGWGVAWRMQFQKSAMNRDLKKAVV